MTVFARGDRVLITAPNSWYGQIGRIVRAVTIRELTGPDSDGYLVSVDGHHTIVGANCVEAVEGGEQQ